MYARFFVAVLFTGFLHMNAGASSPPAIPFADGLWQGDVKTASNGSDVEECWASTTFGDGTTFTLSERKDGTWNLYLSNSGWRLPISRRYAIVALVDFYPRLRIVGEARSETLLEIADLERSSLLGQIENGHTIDLASDGFNEKYELEGAAKVIARIRSCFADR